MLQADEVRVGILRQPVVPEFKMQMRPGGVLARVAADGHGLARAHPVADAFEQALVMFVDGNVPVGVLHGDGISPFLRPVGEDDVAVADSADHGTLLDGNIDGLIHLTDLSWHKSGDEAVRDYQKGQEVEAMVLSIDPERERISLGIKQMEQDPVTSFMAANKKGSLVKGTVTSVDAKAAVVDLGEGVEGTLRASELSRDRVEDASTVLKVGDEVEAKLIGIDRKSRAINLSIKAKDYDEEAEAMKDYASSQQSASTKLGDLLKEQMDSSD